MQTDTRNLLTSIGQQSFSYRDFDEADHGALLVKWPLIGAIAASAELRDTPLGQSRPHRPAGAGTPRSARLPGRDRRGEGHFLDAYDPAMADRSAGAPVADVRTLLGRLSEDLL